MRWNLPISISVIVGSLLLNVCHAEVPWQKKVYFDNKGGLNDQQSTTEIADGEATDIQNIVFDTGGALKKRYGYVTLNTNNISKIATGTAVSCTGLTFYKKDNGKRYLVAIANNDGKATAMKKDYDTGGGVSYSQWENIDYEILPSGYLDTNLCDFVVAEDNLVFTVGVNTLKPFKWTGSNKVSYLTNDANCPTATIIEYHKNQLFLSGNNTYPSRVYFSNLDDITTYTATDFFDVQTSDGTKVRALLSAYDSLYIFKDESIWRLSGYERDSFRLEKLVDGVGTLSNNSVVATNTGIYFVSAQNDIFHYDGAYTVTNISSKISQTISNTSTLYSASILGIAYSTYRFQDADYYVSINYNGASTNNSILLFDTYYKAWTRFDGIKAQAWCVAENDATGKSLFFADYSGYVHTYPSTDYYDGNVSTSPISAVYQTKWFRYPEVGLGNKYWRLLKTYVLSEEDVILHAECKSDYESSGKVVDVDLSSSAAEWDVALWDVDLWGGQTIIVGRSEIEKGVNMFQIRFYNEEVNQGFTLLGYENYIEPTDQI